MCVFHSVSNVPLWTFNKKKMYFKLIKSHKSPLRIVSVVHLEPKCIWVVRQITGHKKVKGVDSLLRKFGRKKSKGSQKHKWCIVIVRRGRDQRCKKKESLEEMSNEACSILCFPFSVAFLALGWAALPGFPRALCPCVAGSGRTQNPPRGINPYSQPLSVLIP